MAKAKRNREPSEAVAYWLKEIAAARKREDDYRKEGKRIREIYAGEKKETQPFNILFSNTETMLPALFSAIPRPVVQRRYKDEDEIGKAAAKAGQRCLEFLLDTNIDGYETFGEGMKWVTLDALLPGRGVSTVKYDADLADYPTDKAAAEEGEASPEEPPVQVKKSELVCTDAKSWDRVFFGYARKWSKVPWIAYEEHIDKDEAIRLFGESKAKQIEFTTGEREEDDRKKADDENMGERKTALVYQIWDKSGGRKIRYVSPHFTDDYLKVEADPLQLSGFFNCPQPLTLIDKTDDLVPTSIYSLYENQAKELNSLTQRINRIIAAMKARGLYDGALGDDIGRLMEADDNILIPADKAGTLAANGGLDKAIWFMPLEKLIVVLKELYVAREQCKQVIYEIMGISDILRGASDAQETATAQQIKTQWGGLRLKPKQAEIQRYARDLLRMMLEIAATKFSEETWARMTGLPYLTEQQMAQATAVAQAAAAQGQMEPAQQLQQQITWTKILTTLRDDMERAYKVDIETNSTVEPEAVEDQKNISDLLTAIGEFLKGVAPLILQGAMPFETAQTMLLTIVRRFRFGSEIEDQIKQMKPPTPPDDGEAQKQQQQAMQKEQQAAAKSMQDQAKIQQLETALKANEADKALNARKAELDVREAVLSSKEQHFQLEQKVAGDTLKKTAEGEHQKLDHKKQVVGLESKNAKTEQALVKQTDAKLSQSVEKMGQLIQGLTEVSSKVLDAVTQQSEQTKALVDVVKAPRKRTVKSRDANGRIAEVSDEVAA